MLLIALALLLQADAAIRWKSTGEDRFAMTIDEGVTVADMDAQIEELCTARKACSIMAYLGGRRVYVVNQDVDRESRRLDCTLFEIDDEHECLVGVAAPLAASRAVTAPLRARRATPVASRSLRSRPQRGASGAQSYFRSCAAARAAGAAPIRRGDAAYSRRLDRDGDGVACE